jgi:hypothetical protein
LAQDWSVHALVYFYSAGSDLPWAIFYWRLDMESADMTKDEALQMCLEYIETNAHERRHVRWAIKEALAQPEQEAEIKRLTACLKLANAQAEEFERKWYLLGDEIERLKAAQPAQPPLPMQERYFCQRCGKPVNLTTIHTCTPPIAANL